MMATRGDCSMKKFPIGVSNFRKIIQEDFLYVDKTHFVQKLFETGDYFFLSRPRRFGKTLLIDTLREAFEGNRELFKDLWLEDHWDWGKKHPVIHISFGGGLAWNREELDRAIWDSLKQNQERLGVFCTETNGIAACFGELIRNSSRQFGEKTVVLIDEYDKPILDNISNSVVASEIREGLKNLYSVVKVSDAHIRFVLLTGVSKFSKVSLFSGLNNLIDITLDAEFGAICGYTESELQAAFVERLEDHSLDDIRQWYDGYNWLDERVYNPFSILNFFRTGEFRNYWFETGTPEFLVKRMLTKNYLFPRLENLWATENLLGSFDLERIEVETLLFQTGYLTIREKRRVGNMLSFRLDFPNLEVKMSFADTVSGYLVSQQSIYEMQKLELYDALERAEIPKIETVFRALFAAIPHDWYRKNNIADYEGYYASIFYGYFAALGLDVTAEDATSHGRIDLTVKLGNRVFIFEFKVVDLDPTPGRALAQIRERGYEEKFRTEGVEIFLIGVEFDRSERNIVGFEWEKD